jgi:hypothetical protein
MKVIESLGVKDDVLRKATRARDGTETMRFVLEEKFDFGITQISEILQASRDAVSARCSGRAPFPHHFAAPSTLILYICRVYMSRCSVFLSCLALHSANGNSPGLTSSGDGGPSRPLDGSRRHRFCALCGSCCKDERA